MAGMLFTCMLGLSAEKCVLKPLQAIGKKHGQQSTRVRACALELGARNQQGTIMDIKIEISFMQLIK